MTEERSKKPGRPIGNFGAFGGAKRQDKQISSNPDENSVEYSGSPNTDISDVQKVEQQDKQMVSYLREKKPERKAQIAYLPPALIKRMKRFAVDHDKEISEVVAEAVEQYLDGQEGNNLS